MPSGMKMILTANTRQAQQALKDVGNVTKGLSKQTKVLSGVLLSVAAAAAVAVKRAIDYGDYLEKTSHKTGLATSTLSEYKLAAELAGTSQAGLVSGLQRLQKNMGAALRSPTSASAIAFKNLGLEFQNADGSFRDLTSLFPEFAERMSKMEDGTLKTQIAMDLMGRSGAELIPILNLGADGIQKIAQESAAMGVVWDTESSTAAAHFNDELVRMKTRIDGLVQTTVREWLPTMLRLAKRTNEVAAAFDDVSGRTATREMDAQADAMKRITTQREKVADLEETIRLNRKGAAEVGVAYGSRSIHQYYDRELETAKKFLGRLEAELGLQAGIIEPPEVDLPKTTYDPEAEGAESRAAAEKKRIQKAYDRVVAGLLTEEEARDAARKREIDSINEAEKAKIASAEEAAQARLDVVQKYEDEKAAIEAEAQEKAQRAQEKEDARLQKFYAKGVEEARRRKEEQAQMVEQEQAAQVDAAMAIMDGVSQFAGQINEMVAQTYGEGSAEAKESARATFMIQKFVALGQAAVLGAVALQQAAASAPPPFNVPAIAAQAAIVGVNIATIMATTVAGVVADAGLPPGALRAAGFGEHTTVMMRRDEMILDRKGTAAISRMLEGGSAAGQPVTVNTTLEIDGRVLGHTVDNHLIRSKERGIGYADRIRYGTR